MILTHKQQQVLLAIEAGNPDGSVVDLDQVIERVDYKPTKAAIQFTIRALIGHGLIEKAGADVRRDRQRVLLAPTVLGMHFAKALKPSLAAALTEV